MSVAIKIDHVCKKYGDNIIIPDLTANIKNGEFFTLLGPSGCGKTTLLRVLGGLEQTDSGCVQLADGLRLAPVFQEARLIPWLTVAENITLAARADKALEPKVLPQLLQQLGLNGCENLYPHELSGGMAQRTALGRTLFYNPDVILMDEPFSALDYFTRQGLQQTLLYLYKEQRKTIIFVTHDVEEALLLADRILIMDSGTVKNDVPVLLPKPRQAADSDFQLLRKKILQAL